MLQLLFMKMKTLRMVKAYKFSLVKYPYQLFWKIRSLFVVWRFQPIRLPLHDLFLIKLRLMHLTTFS